MVWNAFCTVYWLTESMTSHLLINQVRNCSLLLLLHNLIPSVVYYLERRWGLLSNTYYLNKCHDRPSMEIIWLKSTFIYLFGKGMNALLPNWSVVLLLTIPCKPVLSVLCYLKRKWELPRTPIIPLNYKRFYMMFPFYTKSCNNLIFNFYTGFLDI